MPPVFGPDVALIPGFVVLRGGQRHDGHAVGNDDKARFFAFEKFFHDDARAGIAETAAFKHAGGGFDGLIERHCDDDAFTGGQTVRLYDYRCALGTNIGERGIEIRETLVVGGRNIVAGEKILGKCFRAFELRGGGLRSETGQSQAVEMIDNACDEWRFGPTIVRPTFSSCASFASASMSCGDTSTLRTLFSRRVPALPGATRTSSTSADWAHFHASACSRPPPPMIRTFMVA